MPLPPLSLTDTQAADSGGCREEVPQLPVWKLTEVSTRTLEQVQPCYFSQLSHTGSKCQTSTCSSTPAHLKASPRSRNPFLLSSHPQSSLAWECLPLGYRIKTEMETYHPAFASPAETKTSGGLSQGIIRDVIATGQQRVLF